MGYCPFFFSCTGSRYRKFYLDIGQLGARQGGAIRLSRRWGAQQDAATRPCDTARRPYDMAGLRAGPGHGVSRDTIVCIVAGGDL